ECLSRMIFFSEKQLRTAVGQFVEHYHSERNHQGMANRLIEPEVERDKGTGKVIFESRLGGLLNHYRRVASTSSEFWNTTGSGAVVWC
ncbi:MAG: putative transposase, partial [Verrucomicrobiales bacterium]